MPRKAALVANKHIHTTVPYDLAARFELTIFSEVEGRVPQGAYQAFVIEAIRDKLDNQSIDLAPFLGTMPGECVVRGRPETIRKLVAKLKEIP